MKRRIRNALTGKKGQHAIKYFGKLFLVAIIGTFTALLATVSFTGTPRADAYTSTLAPGQILWPGRYLFNSVSHADYNLVMQTDGNLVLYQMSDYNWANGRAISISNTWGHSGAVANMQTDGNLVVSWSRVLGSWASSTQP